MERPPYRDRDYSFGQKMLTLRTAIGLTQAELAALLEVSRRAVGDWEAGNKYPKAEHLKEFIAIGVERESFPPGHEEEEVRAFWRTAHQKVLLDEAWLDSLLQPGQHQTQPSPPALTSMLVAQPEIVEQPGRMVTSIPFSASAPPISPSPAVLDKPRVDWGSAPTVRAFYGRKWELQMASEWVVEERCRVVSVLGLAGIGKSALAVTLMHRIAEQFEVVIWRSLQDLPTSEELLDDLLQTLTPGISEARSGFEQRISTLLDRLRQMRVLLVLDNAGSVIAEGEGTGHMRSGYESFGWLLYRVAETEHQSCVLLTSREKPSDLVPQEGSHSPVRALRLGRLDAAACEALLAEKGVKGTPAELARLTEAYAGNPLALSIVSQTITDLFDGDLSLFLEQGVTIYGGVRQLLDEQLSRLSKPEQSLLTWFAIMREPATLDQLRSMLVTPFPPAEVLDAIEGLYHRNLIERGPQPGSFTLQSVILEYTTTVLLSEASNEIWSGQLNRMVKHGLELAYAKDYVRETQQRLLVAPLLSRLQAMSWGSSNFEAQLITLLDRLRDLPEDAQGYGPANLLALLRLQRGNLNGLDLSRLGLRGVNLQGVEMHGTSVSGASIRHSVFTETFDVLTAVAISKNGQYWAAAGRRGKVRVWVSTGSTGSAGGYYVQRTPVDAPPWPLTLRWMWQAHTDRVWALAFSPDERMLVSGSWDGTLKIWDLATGDLLWSGGHTNAINSVAFAPDGRMFASCGSDATVRLWDSRSGTQLQVIQHPGPVVSVAWRQDGQDAVPENQAEALLASGDEEGTIRLWAIRDVEGDGEPTAPATSVRVLKGHSDQVWGLAFAPQDNTLASASWDGSVRLWDSRNGYLRKALTGHNEPVNRLAWSSDGRMLAGAGRGTKIWMWDADEGSSVVALSGHTPGIWGLAFAPGNSPGTGSLVTTTEDVTLRVWDLPSAKCVRIMQGFASALYDLDWSPDGTKLVTGGSLASVTVWNTGGQGGEVPPKVFLGHQVAVFGVAWSPDGRWIASSEWNNSIRLWDPNTGETVQALHHLDEADNLFYGLSWSPDGRRLACGTYAHGIQVFEEPKLLTGPATHFSDELTIWIRPVSWSPDGTLLAGGGNDGTVYIWDAADNMLMHRLTGHHAAVKNLAWSPDSALLASCGGRGDGSGGQLQVWDARTRGRLEFSANHPEIVYSVAWGLDETVLISGDGVGTLRWWDLRTGVCVRVRQAHEGTIQSLRRSPDGRKLASCGDDGAVMIWDLEAGEHIQTYMHDRPYEGLDITGIRGLTEAQKATLRALGAIEGTGLAHEN